MNETKNQLFVKISQNSLNIMKLHAQTRKQSFTESLQNLLQIKLQEATPCGLEQPISVKSTRGHTIRPFPDMLLGAFKYIFLLDKLKAVVRRSFIELTKVFIELVVRTF